jgi:hypothetical protein
MFPFRFTPTWWSDNKKKWFWIDNMFKLYTASLAPQWWNRTNQGTNPSRRDMIEPMPLANVKNKSANHSAAHISWSEGRLCTNTDPYIPPIFRPVYFWTLAIWWPPKIPSEVILGKFYTISGFFFGSFFILIRIVPPYLFFLKFYPDSSYRVIGSKKYRKNTEKNRFYLNYC